MLVSTVSSPSNPGTIFSYLRRNETWSVVGNAWVCSKASQRVLSFFFLACHKNEPISHLLWEIPNVFMHYSLDTKLRHSLVSCYTLAMIVVNYGLDLSNKFGSSFLIRTIRVSHPSCCSIVIPIQLIQQFSNCSYGSQNNIQIVRS